MDFSGVASQASGAGANNGKSIVENAAFVLK
jgi:hypothetical protein